MKLLGRTPVSGEPELVAALETARSELVRTEAEASAAIANARTSVTLAQSRLDDHRLDVIRQAAQEWRQEAGRLRGEAERAADTTVVVRTIRYGGPDGAVEEPQLRYRRAVLREQADGADYKAQLYENYISRGRDSAMLTTVIADLELPEAETVTA